MKDKQVLQGYNLLFTSLSSLIDIFVKSGNDFLLNNNDIDPFITEKISPEAQIIRVESIIQNQQQKEGSDKINLFGLCLTLTKKSFFIGLLFQSLQNLIGCLGIFILDMITEDLKNFDSTKKYELLGKLIGLVGCFFSRNILFSRYSWNQSVWQAQMKATLQYLLYKKSLSSSGVNAQSSQQNEDEGKENETQAPHKPDILNLMTVDVDEVLNMYYGFIETFNGILTLCIVLYLIYYKIGSAVVVGVYVMIGAFFINIILTVGLTIAFQVSLQRKDSRVSLTKDVLSGIKSIKYFGWQNIFERKIGELRKKEQNGILTVRIFDGLTNVFWSCISYVLLYTFLVKYVDNNNSVQSSNIFTIIALFGYLTYPLGCLPWAVGNIIQASVSYNRIYSFINQKSDIIKRDNLNLEANDFAIQILNKKFYWYDEDEEEETKETKPNQTQTKSDESLSNINIKDLEETKEKNDLVQNLLKNEQNQENSQEKQKEKNFQLLIRDLRIKKGTLNFIIGEIASGKSSLLQAILGELKEQRWFDRTQFRETSLLMESVAQDENQSSIFLNGRTCYVSQNHWLQNKSIRDNILFGNEYEERWYNICIKACQLEEDLKQFKKGDLKNIGPDGNNLSGGQKQRISICRAIYSKSDIYLFDDILSSLDTHVALKLYEEAIVKILIQQHQSTVLFITSHYEILKSQQIANNIIYVENGRISTNSDTISAYLIKSETNKLNQALKLKKISSVVNVEAIELMKQKSSEIYLKQEDQKINKIPGVEEEDDEESEEEVRERGDVKWSTYGAYIKSLGVILLILFVIWNFSSQASQTFIDFWLKDQAMSDGEKQFQFVNDIFHGFKRTFTFLILINVGFSAIKVLFYVISTTLSSNRMFININQSIIRSKMTFFDKNPTGRIINRVSEDLLEVDQYLPYVMQYMIQELSCSFWYAIGICLQLPWILALFVLGFILIYRIQKKFKIANREIKRLSTVNSGKLLTIISETCKGLTTIRAFGNERFMVQSYLVCLYNSSKAFLLSSGLQAWMMIRLLMVNSLILCFVVITSIVIIFMEYTSHFSTVSMCLTYSMTISSVFCELVFYFFALESNLVSVERLRQYFNNHQEQLDVPIYQQEQYPITQMAVIQSKKQVTQQKNFYSEFKERFEADEEDKQNYHLIFENVFLSYDNQEHQDISNENIKQAEDKQELNYALKGISFKLKKGEKIAFYGRTGSGKTSILNALFNLYKVDKGNIFINNNNIKLQTLRQLRTQLTIIPQFGFVFEDTLQNNLDPENRMKKEDIQQILDNTHLSIKGNATTGEIKADLNQETHEQELKVDLDLKVSVGGENLSNGEKQILNYFRILLQQGDIICLDEATSNMDPYSDQVLHEQLFKFCEDKTLIVIAHRLENIHKFDRVFVMDQGNIVEQGHISELSKNKNGFFSELKDQY